MVHVIEIPFLVNLDRLNYLMCPCAVCPIPSFHKDFLLRIFPIVGSHDSILKAASCPPGRSQDSPETSSAVAVANQDFRITVEDEPLPPAPPPAPPIPKQEARKKKMMIVSSHNKNVSVSHINCSLYIFQICIHVLNPGEQGKVHP